MQKMNQNGFSRCAEMYIERLRKEGRYSTAHVYKNALLSFTPFCGTFNVSFRQVTRGRLRCDGPVSYTHLDVYKRQIINSLYGFRPKRLVGKAFRGINSNCFAVIINVEAIDVYKRQIMWCIRTTVSDVFPDWCVFRMEILRKKF